MTVIGHKHKEAEESEAGEALILPSYEERGGMCFMLITVHFSGEQMGSFASIF